MVELLSARYRVPDRPRVDVLSQLALFYLVGATGDRTAALGLLAHLCGGDGRVSSDRLLAADAELLAGCVADRVETAISGLHAVGRLDLGDPGADDGEVGFDERCRRHPLHGRKVVAGLPGMTQQRADWLLLSAGALPTVAPTAVAMQVATRVGYPGHSYESVARSLDTELPGPYGDGEHAGPEAVDLAWRAHHLLDRHGRAVCGPTPGCAACALREACPFRGEGEDPAQRIEPESRSTSSFPPRPRAR